MAYDMQINTIKKSLFGVKATFVLVSLLLSLFIQCKCFRNLNKQTPQKSLDEQLSERIQNAFRSLHKTPHLDKVLSQLAKQQKPNDSDLEKAINEAVSNDDTEAMKVLLEKTQFDINHQAANGETETVLHKACSGNMVDLLVNKGANIEAKSMEYGGEETPLQMAAWWPHPARRVSIVQRLLHHGADVTIKNKDGQGILQHAIGYGHWDGQGLAVVGKFINLCIAHGIDVNAQDTFGKTALHSAAEKKYYWIVEELIKQGAKTNVQDENGETPLHVAIRGKNHENNASSIEVLLKNGADIDKKDKNGATPLHTAVDALNVEAVELLLKYSPHKNAIKNAMDMQGQKPIGYLASAETVSKETGKAEKIEKIRKLLTE